jgi:hypothetical protein
MAPILDGLGLILVIISYYGRISIGISSCEQIVPDPDVMAECIARSLDELEQAVSRADPAALGSVLTSRSAETPESKDPLNAFRDAAEALDKAIETLED